MLHYTRVDRLARDKHKSLLGPFVSYEENKVLPIRPHGLYSQHFIFSVSYKCAHSAIMLHYTRLKRLVRDKHSSLLGPFITYEENKFLQIRTQGQFSEHFFFSVSYKWAQKTTVLHYTRLKRLVRDKHSSLLGPFITYEENKFLQIRTQGQFSEHFFSL